MSNLLVSGNDSLVASRPKSLNDNGSIGNIVTKVVNNISQKPPYGAIFFNWPDIVGNNYASIVVPHRVISSKSSGKTLILKCKKGFSTEMQHKSKHFLDLINDFLGKNFFAHLKVIQME
jgi:hypothetical protein